MSFVCTKRNVTGSANAGARERERERDITAEAAAAGPVILILSINDPPYKVAQTHFDPLQIFAVFQSIGERPHGEGLNPASHLVSRDTVGHHTRQHRNLSDPATIVFLLELDRQHVRELHTR